MQGLTLAKNLETNNSAVKCYGLVLSLRGVTWVARRAWVLAMPGQIRPAVGAKQASEIRSNLDCEFGFKPACAT
jgi:hypothetical protein